jgi:hypothetical protein
MDSASKDAATDKVRCVTTDGFPYNHPELQRRVLLGRHQELELPRDEYEKLRERGLVATAEEIEADEARKRQAIKTEIEQQQAQAQKEFEAERARLLKERQEAEDRRAVTQHDRLSQAAARAKEKVKGR